MILLAIGLAALRASRCREFHCKGLTTCVDNTCQTFLRGDPCQVDTRDVELHFDFYYSKEIEVTTTCWKEYVTYRIRELGDSPGMTEAEYDAQNQHTLRRVEKDGDDWAAMGRVVRTPSRFEKGRVDPIDTAKVSTRCDQIRARAAEMVEDDGFVPTGDIDDMWIRDSAAQVYPLLDSHPDLVRKVIEKQAFYIEFDPYANSYGRTFREPSILGRHGWVTTRNYELDSGAYFIRLVHAYWKRTGETLGAAAIKKLLHVWRVEQHHAHSLYRYDELQGGVGTPVGYTGMTWTGFRPSDDKCTYHYHIPDNVFAAVALGYVEEMGFEVGTLRDDIVQGIHMFGVHDGIYCYEVDGLDNCNKMDDANLPSLLSLPYLDPDQTVYDRAVWERTRAFVLSDANPYYYVGKYRGVGSPHTPPDHVWHLSLIVQAMQGDSEALQTLEETASVPGLKASAFHESFHVDNPAKYTRKWFAWADALYLELCV